MPLTAIDWDELPVGTIVTNKRDGDCIKLHTGWRFLAAEVDGHPSEKWAGTYTVTHLPD
jgi:hypothetical protein